MIDNEVSDRRLVALKGGVDIERDRLALSFFLLTLLLGDDFSAQLEDLLFLSQLFLQAQFVVDHAIVVLL